MLIQKKTTTTTKQIRTIFSALADSKQGQEHSYVLKDSSTKSDKSI